MSQVSQYLSFATTNLSKNIAGFNSKFNLKKINFLNFFLVSAFWLRLEFMNIPWTDKFLDFTSANFTAAKKRIEEVVS